MLFYTSQLLLLARALFHPRVTVVNLVLDSWDKELLDQFIVIIPLVNCLVLLHDGKMFVLFLFLLAPPLGLPGYEVLFGFVFKRCVKIKKKHLIRGRVSDKGLMVI